MLFTWVAKQNSCTGWRVGLNDPEVLSNSADSVILCKPQTYLTPIWTNRPCESVFLPKLHSSSSLFAWPSTHHHILIVVDLGTEPLSPKSQFSALTTTSFLLNHTAGLFIRKEIPLREHSDCAGGTQMLRKTQTEAITSDWSPCTGWRHSSTLGLLWSSGSKAPRSRTWHITCSASRWSPRNSLLRSRDDPWLWKPLPHIQAQGVFHSWPFKRFGFSEGTGRVTFGSKAAKCRQLWMWSRGSELPQHQRVLASLKVFSSKIFF